MDIQTAPKSPAAEVTSAPEELARKYDQPGPRYTSYPTAPVWTQAVGPHHLADRLESSGRADPETPLSVYFHLPFCKRLCTYCGCNIVISRDQKKADEYIDHLVTELDLVVNRLGKRRKVTQLHWGGGTPTFLDVAQLDRLCAEIWKRFEVQKDAEVSVEVNPVVTTREQLELLRRHGFNRVSMGVQDFDPKVQRTINRYQTGEQTAALVRAARELQYGGVNFDLVYGLPHQTAESWKRTMEQVLEMRPDRFAVYAFAYLPEQIKHQAKLPKDKIPRGPAKLDLFRTAVAAFQGAGYRAVGMDHFALPEDELTKAQERRSLGRNFQGYTVRSAPDVVAFGMSGISDIAGLYAQSTHDLKAYYAALEKGELPTERGFSCSDDDRRRRDVITNLMCNFHVDLGQDGPSYFGKELERLRPMAEDHLVELSGPEITVTKLGRFFVRNIAMIFDAYLKPEGQRRFSQTV